MTGYLEGENCQKDLQQENYLDSQIRDMTKNIGEDSRGIRDSGKENKQRKKNKNNQGKRRNKEGKIRS